MFKKILQTVPEIASRIVIGFLFINSGWGKFHDLKQVTAYFESLGIPMANIQAPLVASLELAAGLFILIGLLTRLSTAPLILIMIIAIKTAKPESMTDLSSILETSEFLYIVIMLWLASHGSGCFSLDHLILKKCRRGSCKS